MEDRQLQNADPMVWDLEREPVLHVRLDVVQRVADLVAEQVHDRNDHASDRGRNETVLERRRTLLVLEQLDQVLQHCCFSLVGQVRLVPEVI